MLDITWIQHPIGHGGFHTGRIRTSDNVEFNWIFDCGSQRTKKFDDYIRVWADRLGRPIDWLFISHFDTDHVSGLNVLMGRAVVRDVMVPYLNEGELAYLLLYELNRDKLDRQFVELISDPVAFFGSRGASRITFLGGEGPGGLPFEGDFIPYGPLDGLSKDSSWEAKIRPSPSVLPGLEPVQPGTISRSRARIISRNQCEIVISDRNSGIGVRLKTYRAPLARAAHEGLLVDLKELVGTAATTNNIRPGLGDLAYAIANHARDPKGRVDLRRLFKAHIGSSNRSSMSLLSAPSLLHSSQTMRCIYGQFHSWDGRLRAWEGAVADTVAWVNTGDAELAGKVDLASWQKAYAGDLDNVRVLALPHHGSDKNSGSELQRLCSNALLVAHVRSGARTHPGLEVSAAAGRRLICVDENRSSELQMHVSVWR